MSKSRTLLLWKHAKHVFRFALTLNNEIVNTNISVSIFSKRKPKNDYESFTANENAIELLISLLFKAQLIFIEDKNMCIIKCVRNYLLRFFIFIFIRTANGILNIFLLVVYTFETISLLSSYLLALYIFFLLFLILFGYFFSLLLFIAAHAYKIYMCDLRLSIQ